MIGAIESTTSGYVVLRVGRISIDDPKRGWEQTEHIVLTRNEVAQFLPHVVGVMDPVVTSEQLTLKLKRDSATALLDLLNGNPANADDYGWINKRLTEFVNPEEA